MYVERVSEAETTADLQSALELFTFHGTEKQFSSAKNRDMLLKKSDLITDEGSAYSYFKCFNQIASASEESRIVVAKRQVHNTLTNLILTLDHKILTMSVAKIFLELVCNITLSDEGEEAFLSVEMKKIFIKMAPLVLHDTKGANDLLLSVANLTSSRISPARRMFARESVRVGIFCQLASTAALSETGKNVFVQAVCNISDHFVMMTAEASEFEEHHQKNVDDTEGEEGRNQMMMMMNPSKSLSTTTTSQYPNNTFIKAVLQDLQFLVADAALRDDDKPVLDGLRDLRLSLALKGVDKLVTTSKKYVRKLDDCRALQDQVGYYTEQLEERMMNEVLEQSRKEHKNNRMSGRRRQRNEGEDDEDDEGGEIEIIDVDEEDD